MARDLGFYFSVLDSNRDQVGQCLINRGVKYVGFDGIGRITEDQITEVADWIAERKFVVTSMHGVASPVGPLDGNPDLELFFREIDRAKRWQAQAVIYHFRNIAFPATVVDKTEQAQMVDRVGFAEIDKKMRECMQTICTYAAESDVDICLENVRDYYGDSAFEIVTFIDSVGADNLKICLDSGHSHASSLDIASEIRTAGSKLVTTHFHDNIGPARNPTIKADMHILPGLGTINWIAVNKALDDIGYTKPVIFEGVLVPERSGFNTIDECLNHCITTWRSWEQLCKKY